MTTSREQALMKIARKALNDEEYHTFIQLLQLRKSPVQRICRLANTEILPYMDQIESYLKNHQSRLKVEYIS